jgi:hypothetical protein
VLDAEHHLGSLMKWNQSRVGGLLALPKLVRNDQPSDLSYRQEKNDILS